jgi:3D (Asp-Asp-Asp) domain-containing protein
VGVCATDPRVIPLGTRFDVPGFGSCVAADTGSSVVGATIDIWMPGAQASVYGSQTITITFR